MPLISTRAGASARGFSHMASSIFPGFNNNSTLAVAHDGSPYVTVYKFNDVTGFGTKYTNPASFPTPGGAAANSVDFINNASNPAQSIIVGLATGTDSLVGYRFNTTDGFGATKYTSNAAGTYTYSTASKSDGSVVAAGTLSSPYIVAVPWNVGFGTKYSDPATTPGGVGYSVTFNPAGTVLLAQSSGYPYLHAYAWSSGFGSKYADPTSGISSSYSGHVKFHPTGNFFVSGSSGNAYDWSSGFGTKYATPTGAPGLSSGAEWNPAGTIIAFSDDFANKLIAYDWSSGFGTKYADGLDFPSVTFSKAFAWNPTGTAIAVGALGSPYIYTYSWYNGFQKRYSNPSTLPTGAVNDVAFL
jgi:hypothetical protein